MISCCQTLEHFSARSFIIALRSRLFTLLKDITEAALMALYFSTERTSSHGHLNQSDQESATRKININFYKGGEIWDTKSTLNLSRNIVSFHVFGRCFSFFTLQDQLVAQQKHLLRVEEMQHADWLICLVWIQDDGITTNLFRDKLWVWWKTSNKAQICCSKLTLAILWVAVGGLD